MLGSQVALIKLMLCAACYARVLPSWAPGCACTGGGSAGSWCSCCTVSSWLQIVWDEHKKCWVDKNAAPGDADIQSAAPPTDSSFGGKPTPPSGKPGENRFQMAKQRSLRKHYVDVLNPGSSKASGDSPAVPGVPPVPEQPGTQSPPQFLVPQAVDDHCDSGYDFVSPAPMPDHSAPAPPPPPPETVSYQQPSGKVVSTPMMFDPADFSSRAVDSSHKMAGGNLARRRAYPT
ncbi:hypothetical protein V5799_025352 [Amblyomma americanum]|uniref:Secreted protein n=1 Tax=Amblyomma americanum TaxID=6943 RepID=A0AAQ4E9Y1_AMBAM